MKEGSSEEQRASAAHQSHALRQSNQNRSGFPMPLLTVFIGLLSMAPALSSDLYMPGLPTVTEHLNTTQTLASYTLATFFLLMAVGVLVLGPLSDMYGRKKVLLASNLTALVACISCAFTPSIEVLLVLRAIQGFGSGGMVAISTTLAKDCYSGDRMARVIGLAQSVSMTAPILAPLIGVAVLYAVGWRGSFLCMSVVFTTTLILCFFMKDTLPEEKRIKNGLVGSLKDITGFFKRPQFMTVLIAAAVICMPFYDYLGIASFVYEEHFGLSEFAFGVIFACTALTSILGPLVFARAPQKFPAHRTIFVTLCACAVSMVILLTIGSHWFQAFMLAIVIYMFSTTIMRPSVTTCLLAPLEEGVGAASSLINFVYTFLGCIGMLIGSAGWDSVIFGMAMIMICAGLISFGCWLISRKVANESSEK